MQPAAAGLKPATLWTQVLSINHQATPARFYNKDVPTDIGLPVSLLLSSNVFVCVCTFEKSPGPFLAFLLFF